MSDTAALDAGQHPLRWAVTRGVVMRHVHGGGADCPFAEGTLDARCWHYGHRQRLDCSARQAEDDHVSRETDRSARRKHRWSDDDKADLLRLIAAGFKSNEAAVILGRPKGGIEGQLKRLRRECGDV